MHKSGKCFARLRNGHLISQSVNSRIYRVRFISPLTHFRGRTCCPTRMLPLGSSGACFISFTRICSLLCYINLNMMSCRPSEN